MITSNYLNSKQITEIILILLPTTLFYNIVEFFVIGLIIIAFKFKFKNIFKKFKRIFFINFIFLVIFNINFFINFEKIQA